MERMLPAQEELTGAFPHGAAAGQARAGSAHSEEHGTHYPAPRQIQVCGNTCILLLFTEVMVGFSGEERENETIT